MLKIIEKDLNEFSFEYEKDDRLRGAVQEGYQGRRLLEQVHKYTKPLSSYLASVDAWMEARERGAISRPNWRFRGKLFSREIKRTNDACL